MSSKQKVNDSNENLIVESDDKPSQSGNTQDLIGSRTEKKSMRDQLDLNWKFLQLHRKLGHMSEDRMAMMCFHNHRGSGNVHRRLNEH
jgi:hypothetical protein